MSTWHFWNLFEEYLEMQYYLFLFWPKFVFHLLQPILSIFMTEPCIGKLHTMKRKKYVMKHPQNINRSECIMKCAWRAQVQNIAVLSVQHLCIHLLMLICLSLAQILILNQQRTVQKWSGLGFASHMKRKPNIAKPVRYKHQY